MSTSSQAQGQGLHLSKIPRYGQDPRHQPEPKVVGCRMRAVHTVWMSDLLTALSGRLNKHVKAAGVTLVHPAKPWFLSGKPSRGSALQESLIPLPVRAEVFAQGACTGPGEFIQTQEGVPGMIFSCIDLVIAALGEDVKRYELAHAFEAQMGTVRISPLLFTQGFLS